LVRSDGQVHRTLFTDPAIFEDEMIKIFGGSWVFLLHEAEIPAPFDFKTTTVGRRPVIVSRAADGAIHAILNRCTHRGSLVCVENQGNSRRFQCPYHSWTFGIDGELQSVTFPDGHGPSFDKAAHNLKKLPRVESYRGYVFGSLNPDVEPLIEWIGAARQVFDWCIDREQIGPAGLKVVKGTSYTLRANWKLQNDNNNDAYHAPFLHFSTAKMNQQRYGAGKGLDHLSSDQSPMFVEYLGNGHKLLDQRPAIASTWERTRPIPGKEFYADSLRERVGEKSAPDILELVGRTGINLILYPNLFVMGHGTFAVYEPVTVNKTNVRYYSALANDAPEELNILRIRFAEDFNNLGVRDDNEGMERVQEALEKIPEVEWLDYSRGLGTNRESKQPNGAIRGNVMDETGQRGSYEQWRTLMNRSVRLTVV
jgi:phenylpropionate dioxygenase-like ring-hydroxylating dioxygenase large terminal subunit